MPAEDDALRAWDAIAARTTRAADRRIERTARLIAADQTNESWVVGESVVVKLITEEVGSPHPALAKLHVLDEANFRGTPRFWGSRERDGITIAYALDYVPHSEDGWTWAVREAALHFGADSTLRALDIPPRESRPFANDLGHLTANMHAITTHGDFHVGNLLRVNANAKAVNADDDGRLYVIDFDGNPTLTPEERRRPRPPEYDIAGMLVSLEAVGIVAKHYAPGADDRTAQEWSTAQSRSFLRAYLSTPGAAAIDANLVDRLARDQVYRELDYAVHHLPRWRYVPEALMRRRGWPV